MNPQVNRATVVALVGVGVLAFVGCTSSRPGPGPGAADASIDVVLEAYVVSLERSVARLQVEGEGAPAGALVTEPRMYLRLLQANCEALDSKRASKWDGRMNQLWTTYKEYVRSTDDRGPSLEVQELAPLLWPLSVQLRLESRELGPRWRTPRQPN